MPPFSSAPLVIIKGLAGRAKTFYTLAVGLEKILNEESLYRKILLCSSNARFDREIGFLPGSEREKIAPPLRPVTMLPQECERSELALDAAQRM